MYVRILNDPPGCQLGLSLEGHPETAHSFALTAF